MYQKPLTNFNIPEIISKLKELADEGYYITIEKNRSLDQNSRYNILIRLLSDFLGYTPNECKYALKENYGLVKNGKAVSTKNLSVHEMAKFITLLENKCIEFNIKF